MLLKQLGHVGAPVEMHMRPDTSIGKQTFLVPGSILDAVGRFDCIGYRKQGPDVILHLEVAHTLVGNARIECVVREVS